MSLNTIRSNTIYDERTGNEDIDEIIALRRQEFVEALSSDPKEYFAQKMGSYLHEEWRKTRLKEDGTYEPRMKKSKDLAWTEKHGTDDVDIANTKFEDLPSNWQYENLEAAKVVVNLVYDKVVSGEEITPEMIEEMSSVVHEKWLERNDWAKDGELGVPYNQLPEHEKAKDRAQVEAAIQIIGASQQKRI